MDTIVLSEKWELDIYLNPQRQNLLRSMRIAGVPMTAKQLSDEIGISPSSVQHHIRKLAKLGVVELDHTKCIRGISARFFRVVPKDVCIGVMFDDGNSEQRLAWVQSAFSTVASGYVDYCRSCKSSEDGLEQHGDALSGVIRLTREEAKELYNVIRVFLDMHQQNGREGDAWEYSLIAYPVKEADDA